MGAVLFLLFVIVPIVEIALFIEVGGMIGPGPTIGIVVATAALGAYLARREGLSALLRTQQRLEQGELPADELKAGFAIGAGALLLLTPGFLTDILGFSLLLPPTRALILRAFTWWFRRCLARGRVNVFVDGEPAPPLRGDPRSGPPAGDDVIDLTPDEFEVR